MFLEKPNNLFGWYIAKGKTSNTFLPRNRYRRDAKFYPNHNAPISVIILSLWDRSVVIACIESIVMSSSSYISLDEHLCRLQIVTIWWETFFFILYSRKQPRMASLDNQWLLESNNADMLKDTDESVICCIVEEGM